MDKTCKNCGNTIERHSKNYCRPCFIKLGTKTKRICAFCRNPLSPAASWSGATYCRPCFWDIRTNRRNTYMNQDWLRENFINKRLSIQQCANLALTKSNQITYWLQVFELIPRTKEFTENVVREKLQSPSRRTMNRGYIYHYIGTRDNGKRTNYTKVPEHKIIMQNHLRRQLTDEERIHHLNGIKTDNRIENLMLFSTDNEHQQFERKVEFFIKQLLWGELSPQYRTILMEIFTDFLSKFE